jgi:ribonuclease J
MNLTIHRGSNEIGGTCVEVESQGQRLLLDLGLPLDAEGDPRQFLPNISGLDGRDRSLLGILISHPHQDHFGLLAEVAPTIKTGVGAAARRILTAAGPFMPNKYTPPPIGWDLENRKPIAIGPFTVTPYLLDHAAFDSYALLIEADGKRLFYSGDFRAHGRKSALHQALLSHPPKNIDVLLLEGTTIGRLDAGEHFTTEQEIEGEFARAFSATKGMALVQCSAQNIDRIVSVFRACRQTGRTLVIDLYAAAILEATGKTTIPQSDWPDIALYVPQSQRVKIKNNAWFDLLNTHAKHRIFIKDLQRSPER